MASAEPSGGCRGNREMPPLSSGPPWTAGEGRPPGGLGMQAEASASGTEQADRVQTQFGEGPAPLTLFDAKCVCVLLPSFTSVYLVNVCAASMMCVPVHGRQ